MAASSTRTIAGLTGLAVLITACSSSRPALPGALRSMASGEVGCVVDYGGSERVMGPLGPGAVETFEPNEYTSFRIGVTPDQLVVVATRERDKGSIELALSELPTAGEARLVGSRAFRDQGNPGYEIRCWRGAS